MEAVEELASSDKVQTVPLGLGQVRLLVVAAVGLVEQMEAQPLLQAQVSADFTEAEAVIRIVCKIGTVVPPVGSMKTFNMDQGNAGQSVSSGPVALVRFLQLT